jgi:predicted PurR-regulated permease PerM
VVNFAILVAVGIMSFPTLGGGLMAALAFVGLAFLEGHFVTPAIIGRRLELNALAY